MTKHAQHKTKKRHPIISLLLIAIGVPLFAVVFVIMTMDVNSYRADLEQAFHEQTGRHVKLAGPIAWSASLSHGLSLSVKDVSISNPSWASRPDMARVGQANLHLDLMALLRKQVNIIAFELSKTDVQLETSPSGAVNWDFAPVSADKAQTADKKEAEKKEAKASPIEINVSEVKVKDSRFGMKDKDGKLSLFEVPELTFSDSRKGMRVHFVGTVSGMPMEVDLSGGRMSQLSEAKWPFNMVVSLTGMKIEAKGSIQDKMKKAVIEHYMLTAGASVIEGEVTASLGGTRPSLRGSVKSKKLDPSDFELASAEEKPKAASSAKGGAGGGQPGGKDKIFSRDPIAFDGLKAVDANMDVAIDSLIIGLTHAESVKTKLVLDNGRLALSPMTAQVAGSPVTFDVKVDASTPTAVIAGSLKAPTLDMSQLFKMGGAEALMSGKSNVDIDLSTSGRSSYDFAAHSNGTINLLMEKGEVSGSALRALAGGLVSLFAPGASALSPGVNCMAARYVITNGLLDTKGLLIDTDATTVAGKGYVNLPDERIGMSLYTKPKGLGLTSLIPPMRVSGDLASPSYAVDAASAVQKITGLLKKDAQQDSGVPNLVTVPGKNTCAATLDNPNAPPPTKVEGPLVPSGVNNIGDAVKDTGKKLLEGIGGSGLFGK